MALPLDARRAVSLLYLAGAIVLLVELLEIFALVYPPQTGVASWRFGLLGVTVSRTATFVLADVMLLTAAVTLGHGSTLRALGVLHLILAVALLPVMVLYGLDVLVLRRSIKPEFVRGFDLTAARTLLMCLIGSLAGAFVFLATRRARSRGVAQKGKDAARGVLLTNAPAKETS